MTNDLRRTCTKCGREFDPAGLPYAADRTRCKECDPAGNFVMAVVPRGCGDGPDKDRLASAASQSSPPSRG